MKTINTQQKKLTRYFAPIFMTFGLSTAAQAVTYDDDIVIGSFDGTEIHANIMIPDQVADSYPTIIFINPWGSTEHT